MPKKIEIFRPGRHTASDGRKIPFTGADLSKTAEVYDTALHEAPLVIGHPKADEPAYGWVQGLSFEETLVAEADQVAPEFVKMIQNGSFKKVSASFYEPDSPKNPVPGAYYLRHIGFLGAAPPALKGLRPLEFGEDEEGVVDFVEEANLYSSLADILRGLRDWIIGRDGLEQADRIIPNWQVDNVTRIARETRDAEVEGASSFTEGDPMDKAELERKEAELKDREAKVAEQEASFEERETKLSASEEKTRKKDIVEFVDGLVKGGKVLPRDQAGLVEFMAGQDSEGVVEFGEGDDAVKTASGKWLREFLGHLPKQVDFDEASPAGAGAPESNPQAVADAARKHMDEQAKTGRSISFTEAVEAVTKGGAK